MRNSYSKLLDSEEYKDFAKNEKGFEFVHASLIQEGEKPAYWEFGYYNKKRDRIVVFETNPVKRLPEQEVFKEGPTVKPLSLDDVKVEFETAIKISEMLRQEKYQGEPVSKIIAILQYIERPVWNITLVTNAFNLINMKIDSDTGEVLSDSKRSILDLGHKV